MATILVVDDDAHIREVARFALARAGHTVELATDGAAALARIEAHVPDLVVLDVLMPEVDGFEVCQRLKNNPDTAHIQVLMTSAQQKGDVEKKAKEAGASGYSPKPIEAGTLLDLLGLAQVAASS